VALHYLVMAHRRPKRFADLLDAIVTDDARVTVHIDRTTDEAPFREAASPYSTISFIPERDRVDVRWGGWSQVEATLRLLRSASAAGAIRPRDYVILLSGDSYPLQPPAALERALSKQHHQFINSKPMTPTGTKPVSRFTTFYWEAARSGTRLMHLARAANRLRVRRPYRRALHGRVLHGGSQWWALTGQATGWLLREVDRDRRFVRFCRHTRVPDEFFFQTLLAASPFAGDVRPSLLFSIWEDPSAVSPELVRKKHVKHIVSNALMLDQRGYDPAPALFVRKLAGARSAERIRRTVWPLEPRLLLDQAALLAAADPSRSTQGES
jgi:hypothetical protein